MSHAKEISLSDRLLRYSATASLIASGTAMAAHPAFAADGITDPEPDIVINANSLLAFDIDGDTVDEFEFSLLWGFSDWTSPWPVAGWTWTYTHTPNSSSTWTMLPTTYTVTIFFTMLDANIMAQNAAAGVKFVGSAYPAALASGVMVSAAASWMPGTVATMTSFQSDNSSTWYGGGSYRTHKGNWFDLAGSRYLGVMFDIAGNTHYGWVELECVDGDLGPNQLTIKAYGYNPTPDEGIKTGYTPAAVEMAGVQASGGLQAVVAGAFAAVGGALTWIRRKLRN